MSAPRRNRRKRWLGIAVVAALLATSSGSEAGRAAIAQLVEYLF